MFWLALELISLSMPGVLKGSSTPFAALAGPMAPMPGVQVFASTLAAVTTWGGCFMVAKKSLIILSRKKLNHTRPAQSAIARRNTRLTTMRRFMADFRKNLGPNPGLSRYIAAALTHVSLDANAVRDRKSTRLNSSHA